jgi:hypothetical protein
VSGDTWFDISGFGGSFKINGLWAGGVTWFDTFQAEKAGFAGSAHSGMRKISNKINGEKLAKGTDWFPFPF